MTDVSDAISRLVVEGDLATVNKFLEGTVEDPLRRLEDLKRWRPSSADPHTLTLLDELAHVMKRAETTADQARAMLHAAHGVRKALGTQGERSALVWTGPDVHESALRSTAQVMRDIVEQADSHLLLVTYSLRPDSREPGETLLARLVPARARGVGITVVAHKDEANRRALAGSWPATVLPPRLLTWPIPDGDEMVKLHAKILAADDQRLLVTSANLTYHGLYANLELGIMVEGAVAGEVRRHFDRLERLGHLLEWEP